MGGFGCGINWAWDEAIMKNGFETELTPLAVFMASIDFEAKVFKPQRWPDGDNPLINDFDNSSPPVEAFTSKSTDNTMAFGWAHNRTEYWGNYLGSNNCLSNDLGYHQVGNTRSIENNNTNPDDDIHDDDSTFTSPLTLTQFGYTFEIENLTPKPFLGNTEYLIAFFSTQTGQPIAQDIRGTDNNGTLEIVPPPNVISEPDFAYQLFRIDNKKGGEKDSLVFHFTEEIEVANRQETEKSTDFLDFEVYPNPTQNQITVVVPQDNTLLNVYNLHGKNIYSKMLKVGNNHFRDLFNTKGVYFMEVISGSEYYRTTKIVVQ